MMRLARFQTSVRKQMAHGTGVTFARPQFLEKIYMGQKIATESGLDWDNAPPDAQAYGFRPAGYVELAQDRADVKFDRVFGDGELVCNLLVAQPGAHQPQHLAFARCQLLNHAV